MKKILLLLSVITLLSFNTQQPKTVTVTFTVDELQVVYDALGELPAKKVEVIRAKIIYEASRQLDTTKKK
jgi:VanZ family protein